MRIERIEVYTADLPYAGKAYAFAGGRSHQSFTSTVVVLAPDEGLAGYAIRVTDTDGDSGVAGFEQATQLCDIGFMAAELDRCRQGNRYQPRVLAGVKKAHEVRVGFCDQRHPVTR